MKGIALIFLAAAVVCGLVAWAIWHDSQSFHACVYDPKPDITAYELALLLKARAMTDADKISKLLAEHPELRRHLKPGCDL